MVEQSKKAIRQKRQARRAARAAQAAAEALQDTPVEEGKREGGFLMPSGTTADDIADQDRALRAAFPMWEEDEAEDEVVSSAEPVPEPAVEVAPALKPAPLLLTPAEAAPAVENIAAVSHDDIKEEAVDDWPFLGPMPVQRGALSRNLIITASRRNSVHAAFDVLRTRLVQALSENGWKRVGITSPTRDCGKTFVSVNLAVALSRYDNCRTVLMDMDMRNPSVAKTLALRDVGSIGDYLRGQVATRDQFFKFDRNDLKIGDNLAVAMNEQVESFAGELLQQPETRERLQQMEEELHPDVVLFDLPPALANDDVIAFKSQFDGVLVVIDGTRTSAAQVREVMRRLGKDTPLLGVVLNKAEDATGEEYRY
ncbi:CpsD/CapB family tyrosine-protein kinase [Thalassobius sp. Cn5-15]|uniref:CpsD/CapB family tyrosine-protein kinase n=1 Tax=Thalassobius sp. Cn5-15 TaxID=2917763 RepID=UPI001EF25569|nr:CpsD/CapB family tyrosine-protein kinase [Thalassobius sp. Cn5-15]MCG7494055.1 CpsD/CapB family tyrosine-protein kinase [Thalassobius sp. Cn5-15]